MSAAHAQPPWPPQSGPEGISPDGSAVTVTVPPELVEALAVRVAALIAGRVAPAPPPADGPEPWVGVEDAAQHLACKPKRIYDLVGRGDLPRRKDGTRLLFRRSALDAYLEGQSS